MKYVGAQSTTLSIQSDTGSVYTVDRAGRLMYSYENGWFFARGLNGQMVAKRWKGNKRQCRPLSSPEIVQMVSRFQQHLKETESAFPHKVELSHPNSLTRNEISRWLASAREFNLKDDAIRFSSTYRPVGILPPDQYLSVVIQVTEGCDWNRCHFCTLYRGQRFREKTKMEFLDHLMNVKRFFGEGLTARNSIFLGEANALALPVDELLERMDITKKVLVPSMEECRGFFAFIEPHNSKISTAQDFQRLSKAGMERLYFGLETGSPDLRSALSKPGSLEEEIEAIFKAKEGGLSVGIIVMLGIGGRTWDETHREKTISTLTSLPLDGRDIIFFSPLDAPPSSPYRQWEKVHKIEPLREEAIYGQGKTLRESAPPGIRTAIYETPEFTY